MRGLTWQDERYVRSWTRDTPEWMLLSWRAQGLYHSLRRKADRAGLIHIGKAGRRVVASMLNATPDEQEVLELLAELEAGEWVEVVGDKIIIPEFIESEEAAMTNQARQRAHRERARDQALAGAREAMPVTPERNTKVERHAVTPTRNAKRSRQGVTPSDPSFRAVPSVPDPDQTRSAASALDHSKPHARTHEASPTEPLDADDPPAYHPAQLANFASYGIPLTVPGETKAQGQARRRAALAAALEAEPLEPRPGSSQQGGGEDDQEDPDPPSGRPALEGPVPTLGSPQDAPTPPAPPSRPSEALPAPASALPAPPGHVAVEGEIWPPPAGWIPGPESILRTCGSCSHGRRYPEPLLCPCPLGEHAVRIRAQRAEQAAEEARELAREQKRRAKKLDAPPLFGPETPAELAAANAPDATPLGKLGLAGLLPPPGYGAKIPDDPAALILATLERQPEPIRHLADPGIASRLAGLVMGTKATVAQIEDAIRTGSGKLPAELGAVRADDARGLDRVQRWVAGCLKGCRNQGPGRAAPHDPNEALPIVTRRILARFAAAYREQEGIDYLAGEEDPAHAEVIAGHLKRQVEAAAQRASTAPDPALGGAMLAQLIETWMGSKLGEATGHALAQLAGALRREPARWAYRAEPLDPYAGVAAGDAPAPGFRHPMPPRALKPRHDLDNVVDIFAKKRVSG